MFTMIIVSKNINGVEQTRDNFSCEREEVAELIKKFSSMVNRQRTIEFWVKENLVAALKHAN